MDDVDSEYENFALSINNNEGNGKSRGFVERYENVKLFVWRVMESQNLLGKLFNYFIFGLILISVAFFILLTEPELNYAWLETVMESFEGACFVIFTFEYMLRWWSCTAKGSKYRKLGSIIGRIRFMISIFSIIDAISLIPTPASLIAYAVNKGKRFAKSDFVVIRMLRLLRLIKGEKLFQSYSIIRKVIVLKRKELLISYFIVGVGAILVAGLIYIVEKDSTPEFNTVLKSLWFVLVSLSTVGYGDVVPGTREGRLLTMVLCVLAISAFAIPTSIIGSGFVDISNEIREKKEKARKSQEDEDNPEGDLIPCLRCTRCKELIPVSEFTFTVRSRSAVD